MSQKNIDKLKKKIAALLAKAEGTDNEHEAASFAAKAQALLTEHQLEIGDVVKNDHMDQSVICVMPRTMKNWHWLLPMYMAKYFGCEVYTHPHDGHKAIMAIGRESARITCVMMWPFILKEVRAAAAELRRAKSYSTARCMQLVVDNFVIRIQELLAEQSRQAKKAGQSDGRSLIQISEALVWMKDNVANLKTGKGVMLEDNEEARALADKVNLGRQIDDGNGEQVLAIGDK